MSCLCKSKRGASFQGDRGSTKGWVLREDPCEFFEVGMMPEQAGRLLQAAGTAGSHACLGKPGDSFCWDEKPKSAGLPERLEDLLAGRGAGKWQPGGKRPEEAPAAGGVSRQCLPAEQEQEHAQGRCRGLSAQRNRVKLLLWSKICWNVDTPIPE